MSYPRLVLRGHPYSISSTLVMGVVNASPESFSDAGQYGTLDEQSRRALELVERGADIVDIGGQSAITGQDELDAGEESDRVVPIVEWLRRERPDAIISVDTYKPLVVRDVLAAGAHIINDVSGLLYPETAELCAAAGAGLVIMHTKARPKQRLQDPAAYDDVAAEVADFLRDEDRPAISLGVAEESIIVDPGPDFAKTPHQTIEMLREVDELPPVRTTSAAGALAQGLPRRDPRQATAWARRRDHRRDRPPDRDTGKHRPRARRRSGRRRDPHDRRPRWSTGGRARLPTPRRDPSRASPPAALAARLISEPTQAHARRLVPGSDLALD